MALQQSDTDLYYNLHSEAIGFSFHFHTVDAYAISNFLGTCEVQLRVSNCVVMSPSLDNNTLA